MKHYIKLNDTDKIDLTKMVVSRLLIQANSGGGKSWSSRRIIEQSHGKIQQIIIDPEGEFSTLREKGDYILAGKDGDVPADPRVAGKLAERLLELGVSAIIDLYELNMMERKLFVRLFFEAMVNAPKNLWHPVLVFLDEAHKFAPEKEQAESLEAVIDMASRGRKRGFCLIPMTQRPAKLNKDVAAECNNKMIGRASLDIDRKRSAEELGFSTKEQILSLRDLEPGEFYVFGPAIGKDIKKIKVGEVETSHPKAGGKMGARRLAKPSDKIKKVLGALADLPKEAQEEARTIGELRTENANLKRENIQLKKQPRTQAVNATEVAVAEQIRKEHKAMSELLPKMDKTIKDQQGIIDMLNDGIAQIGKILASINESIKKRGIRPLYVAKMPVIKPIDLRPGKVVPLPAQEPSELKVLKNGMTTSYTDEDTKLGRCERLIYSFLFANQGREFSKEQVGAVTHYSPTSGGFNNALSKLTTVGMIQRNAGKISILSTSPEHQAFLLPGEEFSAEPKFWSKHLGKCEQEIYEFLWSNPHESYSKEDLAASTPSQYSPTSGGFNNALSHLNTIGLIRREGGKIKLNPEILEL